MAKKKVQRTVHGPDVHPNPRMIVELHLRDQETGAERKRLGAWNGTHWSVVEKNGDFVGVPPKFVVDSWSE